MKRRTLILLLITVAVWLGGYLVWRNAHSEVWARDGKTYVLFPERGVGHSLYYLWRPLSWADGVLTGVRTHIGPHDVTSIEGAPPAQTI